ncbi:PAS domain-containing protein [Novosphingobium kaempferiae]|uniref:PAS domain-containing protein n=1 Tax=Novosphingobium kaempferiae TaxID=2896849 RepID=UPI001E4E46B5|nr:PAS domain-containing protein [Novosphingobium kaempferiae]
MASSSVPMELCDFLDSLPIALSLASIGGDHPLVFVNQRFNELTGYPPAETLGRNCRFLQRGVPDNAGAARFRAFLANDDTMSARSPLINFRRDGTPFVNLLYLTRLRGASGETQYVLGSQFDVSRLEADRLRAYDRELADALRRLQPNASGRGITVQDALSVIGDSVGLMAQAHLKLVEPSPKRA